MIQPTAHQLVKDGKEWRCEVCHQQWKGKPRKPSCPGIRWYARGFAPALIPQSMWRSIYLHSLNFRVKDGELPRGCWGESNWYLLYEDDQLEIADPTLPPAYLLESSGFKEMVRSPEMKSVPELRKEHLQPKPNAQPCGCYRQFDNYGKWLMLYHVNDCEPGERLQYITKGRLKDVYRLSDSWLEKLGKPDITTDNPHYKRGAPMQLYVRGRIEDFLAENAEEYSTWLERRDRFIEVAKQNQERMREGKHRSMEAKEKIRHQTKMCLRCASGIATDTGFLCAIYPTGWADDVPQQHFCLDWVQRKSW